MAMKLRILLLLPLLAVVVLSSSGSGCHSDDSATVVEPPLVIRTTDPFDQSFVGTGADTFAINLNVVFRRESEPTDVHFALYPEPQRAGDITLSSTGRNWTWHEVVLADTTGAYFWLIDGVEMTQPVVVRMQSGHSTNEGFGFAGTVTSSNPQALGVAGTLVFAIDPLDGFNPLDPGSFNGIVPLAVAEVDSLGPNDERDYFATYLERYKTYYVVTILDTSGDAYYDPTVDAWGYRENSQGDIEAVMADRAGTSTKDDPTEYRGDVDLTLFPAAVARQRALDRLAGNAAVAHPELR